MYLVILAEGVYRRLEFVRVPYCAEVVRAKRFVGLARVCEVCRP
jgi:hypothetical protein